MNRKPDDRLSTKPQAIRARARVRHQRFTDDLGYYYEHVARKPVEEWDLEELARGKPRGPDGSWKKGATPKWLTPVIQAEAKKRFKEKAFEGLSEYVGIAIRILGELLESDETDHEGKPVVSAREKIDIAKFIVEHVIGKPNQRVALESTPAYKSILVDAIVLDDGNPDYESKIIEGEVVSDDDD